MRFAKILGALGVATLLAAVAPVSAQAQGDGMMMHHHMMHRHMMMHGMMHRDHMMMHHDHMMMHRHMMMRHHHMM